MLVNKEYVTYNLVFGGSPVSKSYMLDDDIDHSINLIGWKKLNYDGHITIKTNFGDFIIQSSTITERKEDIKDKDGRVTGTKSYYSTKIVYNFPINYMVVDYKGVMVISETISSGDKGWTSPEYGIYKEATDYYRNNRDIIRSNISRENMKQALATISNSVNRKIGFPPATAYKKLWILNNKKHPDFETIQNKWEMVKSIATRTTHEAVSENDKQTLLSVIAYFDELKSKYRSNDKNDKKMKYSCFYNNAIIYAWFLDNFDAGIKEADGLIANDFDSGDGKDLKKEFEKLKEDLSKNNITSLHYIINVEDARGPR